MAKGGHNEPEKTTSTKQEFELHIEMGIVNEWRACGEGVSGTEQMNYQSMGTMGKGFLKPLLANVGGWSCFDGSRELIPIFFV